MSELMDLMERYNNGERSPATDIKIKTLIERFDDLKDSMADTDFLDLESFDDLNQDILLSQVNEVNNNSAEIADILERFEQSDRYTEVYVLLINNIVYVKIF